MPVATGTLRSATDLIQRGQAAQAEAILRRALQRDPGDAPANHLMGLALSRLGRSQQAEYFLQAAIRARPAEPSYHNALGNLLNKAGRPGDAASAFTRAVESDPGYFPAWVGLSAALCGADCFEDAAAAGARAVELDPGRFEGHDNLAIALSEAGRVDDAIGVLRRALANVPDSPQILRGLVTALLAREEEYSEESMSLVRRLGGLIAAGPPAPPPPGPPEKTPLRVGFLSPDLRTHSVTYFLEPILEHLDRRAFEAVCYDAGHRPDATTQRLKTKASAWRLVAGLDDSALVQQARRDGIDIMIDLAGHTLGSRVGALALGAAPVQATYLGYAATTGVPGVHYRLVDGTTDPDGAEQWCTERLVRLDPCFLCYRAPADAPDVLPRPADAPVTFGCFNMIQKISPGVLRTWARILGALPASVLLIKNRGLADPRVAERIRAELGALGVDPGRVRLMGHVLSQAEHLALYSQIDIALDTFPYNGTTTTCEALWMGVPVVALAGKTHAGRVGASLLSAAGLGQLVAPDADAYVRVARDLAASPPSLAAMRASLRRQLSASALMDAPAFAARFAVALVRMWRERCGAGDRSAPPPG